ncbi:MAG: glycosyltransferase [Beutenbergiaceae bacterium]
MTSIVVSAGTYHLPFHRLTDWVGQWYAQHPEVSLVVQHGPSDPVAGAQNHEILPYQDLLDQCLAADVVVLQGGAGGIMDMNRLGVIPIVVPRVPVDDEVVDDHQLIFTAEMARLGIIHCATELAALHTLLDQACAAMISLRSDHPVQAPGIAGFAELELPPPRRRWGKTMTRLGKTMWAVGRQRLTRA